MDQRNQKLIGQFGSRFKAVHNAKMLAILEATAWDLIDETKVPVVTHNLWDSIGCGVYHNGALIKMIFPPKKAEVPRTEIFGIKVPEKDYWGHEELEDMVENPPTNIRTHKGWCLYYVAAMPYSKIQDNRSDVDVLREELVKPTFLTYVHNVKS